MVHLGIESKQLGRYLPFPHVLEPGPRSLSQMRAEPLFPLFQPNPQQPHKLSLIPAHYTPPHFPCSTAAEGWVTH